MSDSRRLYNFAEGEFWFADRSGATLRQRWGRANYWFRDLFKGKDNDKSADCGDEAAAQQQLEELTQARRDAGFAELSEAPAEAVLKRFTMDVVEIIEEGECTDDGYSMDYIGGRPRGLASDDWPTIDGAPGLHVLSLANVPGEDVEGLDLFASPSGEFVAIGRTYTDQNKKPKKPPANVPVAQPIELLTEDTNVKELDPIIGAPFVAADPDFRCVVEARLAEAGHSASHRSKMGGWPVDFDGEWPSTDGEPWRFVAQLDFSAFTTAHVEELLGFELTQTAYFFVSHDYQNVEVVVSS